MGPVLLPGCQYKVANAPSITSARHTRKRKRIGDKTQNSNGIAGGCGSTGRMGPASGSGGASVSLEAALRSHCLPASSRQMCPASNGMAGEETIAKLFSIDFLLIQSINRQGFFLFPYSCFNLSSVDSPSSPRPATAIWFPPHSGWAYSDIIATLYVLLWMPTLVPT